VILLLLGCLALFASAYENRRRFDRSGSLTAQVRLDDSQFLGKNAGRPAHIDDDDEDGAFGDVDQEARIAAAIQAAVHLEAPTATPAAQPYMLYRLQLATQTRPNTCVYPCGVGAFGPAGAGSPVQIGWFQGIRVIVNSTSGSFETVFDNSTISCSPTTPCTPPLCQSCSISSNLNNNTFAYTLTATLNVNSTAVTFTLTTPQGAPRAIGSPLNITKVTIETQQANEANPKFGGSTFTVFSPTTGDFHNSATGNSANGLIHATQAGGQFGCTPASVLGGANFDGLGQEDFASISNLGHTQFSVTSLTANKFLVDSFGNASITFTIAGINQFKPTDASIASTYFQLGLQEIPCAQRGNVMYDEIAIVTGLVSNLAVLADPFDNPTFYNALRASVRGAKSNLASFLRQLRIIAGRTQFNLFDAVLDRTPFSLLSHFSKFTPCFRVPPLPSGSNGEISVFIGFGGKKAQTHPTVVLGTLLVNNTLFNATTGTFIPLSPDFTQRPQFFVEEVELANLINPNAQPAVQDPVTSLLADVSILIDNCPAYTYFQ